jgi:hypothetical protein
MNNIIDKSANQLYKESGTTLSFKDWIEREKTKGVHIPNVAANAEMLSLLGEDENKKQNQPDKRKILIRNVAFGITIVVLGVFAYRVFTKKKHE